MHLVFLGRVLSSVIRRRTCLAGLLVIRSYNLSSLPSDHCQSDMNEKGTWNPGSVQGRTLDHPITEVYAEAAVRQI